MNTNEWKVSGPHIMKKPNGEYDGEGWHVCRKSPNGGASAHEWILDRGRVKYFTSEAAATRAANARNKYVS